ncbi:MAG: LEA type 2 family protein [Alphaproteobacteria bacterium]|nr:LEA type 2 family protein [Alphaproteobacteria bacterium]
MVWALLLACAPPVPSASVDGLTVTRLGWTGADAELHVSVDNPLPVSVPVGGLRWAVSVDGTPLLSGERPPGQVLAAGGVTEVSLPLSVAYADALAAATGDDESTTVALEAELSLDTPAGTVALPLSWEAETPRFDPPSITVVDTAVGLRDGDVVLGVQMLVDLPLGAEPRSLGWSAALNGTRLGSGEALVAPGGLLALPIAIDPLRASQAALWVLTGHPSTLGLSWSGSVDTALGEIPLAMDHELSLP